MPKIINLSAIHSLRSKFAVLRAYVNLCDKYSNGCCARSCPGFFSNLTNWVWLVNQYNNFDRIITACRYGQIQSYDFLEKQLSIMKFLLDDTKPLLESDVDRINQNRELFYVLKNVEGTPSRRDYALALLEEAWSSNVELNESDLFKLPSVVEDNDPVFLIANSVELHIHKLLLSFKRSFPTIKFYDNVDFSVTHSKEPIEIAPNIFLCLSYRFNSFKTAAQNNETAHTTMSIINTLFEERLKDQIDKTIVISQHQADLKEARRLNIPETNIYSAQDYFPSDANANRCCNFLP